jgi:hypothetical protein
MAEIAFSVDPQRTCLQRTFFNVLGFDARADLLAAVAQMDVGLDTIAQSVDAREYVYSGWVYWFLFLKGYLRFAETGEVEADNIYLDYLVRFYGPRGHDPGVADAFDDRSSARERVVRRFTLMPDAAAAAQRPDRCWETSAVQIHVEDSLPSHPLRIWPVGGQRPVGGTLVDGWHRLFAARLWGVTSLPGVVLRNGGPR